MKNEALSIRTNKTIGRKFYEPNINISSERKHADDTMALSRRSSWRHLIALLALLKPATMRRLVIKISNILALYCNTLGLASNHPQGTEIPPYRGTVP